MALYLFLNDFEFMKTNMLKFLLFEWFKNRKKVKNVFVSFNRSKHLLGNSSSNVHRYQDYIRNCGILIDKKTLKNVFEKQIQTITLDFILKQFYKYLLKFI